MAEIRLEIPQRLIDSMNGFMGSVKQFALFTNQITRSMQSLSLVAGPRQTQAMIQTLPARMNFIQRGMVRLNSILQMQVSQLMRFLGPIGNVIVNSLPIARFITQPIAMSTIFGAARTLGLMRLVVGGPVGVALGIVVAIRTIWDRVSTIFQRTQDNRMAAAALGISIGELRGFQIAWGILPDVDKVVHGFFIANWNLTSQQY